MKSYWALHIFWLTDDRFQFNEMLSVDSFLFSIRPGWSTIPVLWVCSSMESLSVRQTDRVAPWWTLKVKSSLSLKSQHNLHGALRVEAQTFSVLWTSQWVTYCKYEDTHFNLKSPLCSPGGNVCSTVCAVEDDISLCASSAVNGFKAWSSLTCYQRAKVLLKYSTLSFSAFHPSFCILALLKEVSLHRPDVCVFGRQVGERSRAACSVPVGVVRSVWGLLLVLHPRQAVAVLQRLGSGPRHSHH